MQKWLSGSNEAIAFSIRLMGEEAMRREHLVRIHREVENVEGLVNDRVVNITRKALDSIDRDFEAKRDGAMGKMKFPLLVLQNGKRSLGRQL